MSFREYLAEAKQSFPDESEIDKKLYSMGFEFLIEKSSETELEFLYMFDDEDISKSEAQSEAKSTIKELMKDLKISKYKSQVKFVKPDDDMYSYSILCSIKL